MENPQRSIISQGLAGVWGEYKVKSRIIFMSFIDIESLVNYLLEQFVIKENAEIEKCSVISEQIRNKLETDFKDLQK